MLEVSNFLTFMYSMSCVIISFMQMEVEEEKQHEGIQQYYITKIEALQVTCSNWAIFKKQRLCTFIIYLPILLIAVESQLFELRIVIIIQIKHHVQTVLLV